MQRTERMTQMSKHLSLVISAPSGAGKTTIIRQCMLRNARLAFSVSTTTRSKREGETEAVSYYYVKNDDFKTMIKQNGFLEWAEVHEHYYGTSRKELDRIRGEGKIPVFDVDVQGAKNLKASLPDAVLVFIMPPSIKALSDRLVKRNTESHDELKIRLSNAVGEMKEYDHYDYIVINDRVENAVEDILAIVRSELLVRERMEPLVRNILEEHT
jgi:guanylate kinase